MRPIKRILFATDFSEASREAREVSCSFCRQLGAELHIVHVFDLASLQMPSPYYFLPGVETWMDDQVDSVKSNGRTMLQNLAETLDLEIQTHFVEGRPGKEIVQTAEKNDIDMIVLGTHGYTGLNRLIMGSVAEYVVREAKCPVLVVKPEGMGEVE